MKVDRINYSKLLPTGVYSNERIGLEAELEAGDDAEDCLNKLRGVVESLHKQSCPQYYQEETLPLYPMKTEKTNKQEQIDGFKTAISLCQNKESLDKLFKKLAENTPELQDAYNQKMQSFKNK